MTEQTRSGSRQPSDEDDADEDIDLDAMPPDERESWKLFFERAFEDYAGYDSTNSAEGKKR